MTVVDLAAARARRGLPAARSPHTGTRPTLTQARAEYAREDTGLDPFAGAVLMQPSARVAHMGHHPHRSACGVQGQATPAPPTALVCLRCWPWWYA